MPKTIIPSWRRPLRAFLIMIAMVLAVPAGGVADPPNSAAVPQAQAVDFAVRLPEPIYPEALAARSLDRPGTFEIVDIRPAWQYAEYHVPGAVNLTVDQLVADAARMADRRPLVITCRDGSLSAAVAGIFSQKTERPVFFLHGGVRRYYDEIQRPPGIVGQMPALAPEPAGPDIAHGAPSQPPRPAEPPGPDAVHRPSSGY
jgi:rhodanese-related sulfurtransferase